MVNETLEKVPLAILAKRIAERANEADSKTLEAAKLVCELQSRIEKGEAGKISWTQWARDNIKLSQSRLRELQRIGKAEDPPKELARTRKRTQERVERHRATKKSPPLRNGGATAGKTADLDDERQRLIEWAHSAPLVHVAQALSYIRGLERAQAAADPDRAREPAVM